MKRDGRSREKPVSASTAALALTVALAACVTDSAGLVPCEDGLMCPPRTVCTPTPVRGEMGFVTEYRCDPEGCGDGVLDPQSGEVCDHGNRDDSGCSANCRVFELCGDGKLDPGETCDASAPGYEDECSVDCRSTLTCGDGEVNAEHGEACDEGIDGTRRTTRTCDQDCSIPMCGDGIVNPATGRTEECDQGGTSTSKCDADCTLPSCGDGLRNAAAGEQCDSGAKDIDTPECNRDCTLPVCGDNHENTAAGEECEVDPITKADSATCNGFGVAACRSPFCGDAHVNTAAGEACDDGQDTAACNGPGVAGCQLPECGDGRVNAAAGETCEVTADTNACNGPDAGAVACRAPTCGDGYVNAVKGEVCDDGNDFVFDGCPSGALPAGDPRLCKPATCGDGFVWLGVEACDTTEDVSTCNGPNAGGARCQLPRCGDGHKNEEAGEECDGAPCGEGLTCLPAGDPNECRCGN
jgi:cysteine-rich repeat protein